MIVAASCICYGGERKLDKHEEKLLEAAEDWKLIRKLVLTTNIQPETQIRIYIKAYLYVKKKQVKSGSKSN